MAAHATLSAATSKRLSERREFSRLPAAQAGISRVEMSLRNRNRCRARVINVSAGGLLCRLAGAGPLPTLNEALDIIHLFRKQEEPLSFTGTVRRLAITNGTRGMFCAIEFSAMLPTLATTDAGDDEFSLPHLSVVESAAGPAARISAENFVGRLYTVPAWSAPTNSSGRDDPEGRAQRRRQVNHAFRDIVPNLPEAERWWFFHVVSVLKEKEPDYPSELLAEYLRLCRKGYETAPQGWAA